MVEEQKKDLDIIDKAHLAAERLEMANRVKKELLDREEELEKRMEGRRLLGGESAAGMPTRELTEEEKMQIGLKTYWKGTALEGVFK